MWCCSVPRKSSAQGLYLRTGRGYADAAHSILQGGRLEPVERSGGDCRGARRGHSVSPGPVRTGNDEHTED